MSGRLRPPVTRKDHVAGPDDAPLTLVEYGDYECPYCRAAHPIVQALRGRLGDRLRFAFRHFPLTQIHPYAERAAEVAEAAGEHGEFWEMHDMLYEHQEEGLDDSHLLRYAAALGLDADEVAGDLDAGAYTDAVRADFMSGVRSGVNGTPTFFVNGERYDGPWQTEEELLRGVLESAESAAAGP